MQDKTYRQAVQELQGKMMNDMQDTVYRMITRRTTVANACAEIQDERSRAYVQKSLIVGQLITLLDMMKYMQLIGEHQYKEFVSYLMNPSAY